MYTVVLLKKEIMNLKIMVGCEISHQAEFYFIFLMLLILGVTIKDGVKNVWDVHTCQPGPPDDPQGDPPDDPQGDPPADLTTATTTPAPPARHRAPLGV